jgi:UDP-glucose 4-epimerase
VRYFITGGAGFIGSTMATRLIREGHEVVVLDDLSTGQRENLAEAEAEGGDRLAFELGSILDADLVRKLVAGADRVVHLAAAVGVHNIVNDPLGSLHTNLQGTENVLDACVEEGTRVLVASTSEVYGKNDIDGLDEDADRIYGSPIKSRWSYAEAKALDELLAFVYHHTKGLQSVIVRPFNTVGPKQTGRYGMVLPRFVDQALANEPVTVYGDGTQSRCFLHVEDQVEGMLAVLEHPDALGEPFNIGGPSEITIKDLAERVIAMSGSTSSIEYVPYTEAYAAGYEDMRRRVPNTEKINRLVGWTARYTLDEIIQSVIDHKRAKLLAATTG